MVSIFGVRMWGKWNLCFELNGLVKGSRGRQHATRGIDGTVKLGRVEVFRSKHKDLHFLIGAPHTTLIVICLGFLIRIGSHTGAENVTV